MGKWYDNFRNVALSKGLDAGQADASAGSNTFLKVAVMPAILLVVFIVIYAVRRKFYAAHKQAQQSLAS